MREPLTTEQPPIKHTVPCPIVGAVIEEAARQLMEEGAAAMTPEEQEHLRRFCGELRGPARVFEFKAEYDEGMEPFA